MQIKQYGYDGFHGSEMSADVIKVIVSRLETEKFDQIPKQNILIEKLRDAGWGKKVKIGEYCSHSIDGIYENVGVCGYFGHQQAAFQKLLAFQSLFEDKLIGECFYITQSASTAELRHRLVSGNRSEKKSFSGNGNRISFESLVSAMNYYHRFITVPITIIGIEIDESQINLK